MLLGLTLSNLLRPFTYEILRIATCEVMEQHRLSDQYTCDSINGNIFNQEPVEDF